MTVDELRQLSGEQLRAALRTVDRATLAAVIEAEAAERRLGPQDGTGYRPTPTARAAIVEQERRRGHIWSEEVSRG